MDLGLYPLEKEGGVLFASSSSSVAEQAGGSFQIRQGVLEMSNFDAVQGLVELITLSRSFEIYQKAIDQLIGANGIAAKAAREVGAVA